MASTVVREAYLQICVRMNSFSVSGAIAAHVTVPRDGTPALLWICTVAPPKSVALFFVIFCSGRLPIFNQFHIGRKQV